jgi:hypothetical protein
VDCVIDEVSFDVSGEGFFLRMIVAVFMIIADLLEIILISEVMYVVQYVGLQGSIELFFRVRWDDVFLKFELLLLFIVLVCGCLWPVASVAGCG